MNIGIHFFDLLLWLFGSVERTDVHLFEKNKTSGVLELERARVKWYLSLDENDLPEGHLEAGKSAYRSLTIDGEEVDFSDGFSELHTRMYESILDGGGFGIADARPAVALVQGLANQEITTPGDVCHRLMKR